MRHFRVLLLHELRCALLSGATWSVAALFLALMGAVHWFAVLECSRAPTPWTPTEGTFRLFWVPLLFILPLLTMRTFAEERRSGTLAALLTTPASATSVVWAKFLSTWTVWALLWAAFTAFPGLTEHRLGTPGDARLADPVALWGGLAFVLTSGLMHVAVGVLCSCITRNPALAALLTFIALLTLTAAGGAIDSLPIESWEWMGWLRDPADHLRTFGHLQDFASGVIDSRPLVLYATGTLLCLGLSVLALEGQES
ncbi:MAG: hypothetical protein FJ410_01215 [Verrucomicrobia bacterium]|nr:hypothetical protein [Verrucomicrobiota bacterium]